MGKYFLLLLPLLVMCLSCKRDTAQNTPKDAVKKRLEAYLHACDQNGLSASILVAKDGEIVYNNGLGLKNEAKNLGVTKETIFTIGSLTKQFTATAILQLQEKGKLKVTDPISRFFKNLPEDKQNITIHQLLTHTSGIVGNLGYGVDFVPIAKDTFLTKFSKSPIDFGSNRKFSYSNVGYSLLAMIIEKVAQTDYETYLQENLFHKAGMQQTGYLSPRWDTDQIAHGYKCGEDWGTHLLKWQADSNDISWHLKGNGGILSNPSDLYKWYLALQENKIISKESYAQLTFPHTVENGATNSRYAYGWAIFDSDRDTKIVAHNGSNGVFYADFIQLPEERTVIIYMTNELRYDTRMVAWEIEQLLFNANYAPIVPKMNRIKHTTKDASDKQLQIINEFIDTILKDENGIDDFIHEHLANKKNLNRYKMWFQDLKAEFTGYGLKHILAYEDMSYDIVLESPNGKTTDLTPCFDIQFNSDNRIIAFGW